MGFHNDLCMFNLVLKQAWVNGKTSQNSYMEITTYMYIITFSTHKIQFTIKNLHLEENHIKIIFIA